MKNLIQNRRSAGWNLIEIIVAVAIGASIAAAGVAAYQGEAKKAAMAKARQFISQVETKKASIQSDLVAGVISTLPTGASLDALVLKDMKVQGTPLTGVASNDAGKLGFQSISIGSLDLLAPDGSVSSYGAVAQVTLNGGTNLNGGNNPTNSGASY